MRRRCTRGRSVRSASSARRGLARRRRRLSQRAPRPTSSRQHNARLSILSTLAVRHPPGYESGAGLPIWMTDCSFGPDFNFAPGNVLCLFSTEFLPFSIRCFRFFPLPIFISPSLASTSIPLSPHTLPLRPPRRPRQSPPTPPLLARRHAMEVESVNHTHICARTPLTTRFALL